MTDETPNLAPPASPKIDVQSAKVPGTNVAGNVLPPGSVPSTDEGHYEEVSEYRIGEGPPPLFLVVAFIFIVVWALFSWIPFFGY